MTRPINTNSPPVSHPEYFLRVATSPAPVPQYRGAVDMLAQVKREQEN